MQQLRASQSRIRALQNEGEVEKDRWQTLHMESQGELRLVSDELRKEREARKKALALLEESKSEVRACSTVNHELRSAHFRPVVWKRRARKSQKPMRIC